VGAARRCLLALCGTRLTRRYTGEPGKSDGLRAPEPGHPPASAAIGSEPALLNQRLRGPNAVGITACPGLVGTQTAPVQGPPRHSRRRRLAVGAESAGHRSGHWELQWTWPPTWRCWSTVGRSPTVSPGALALRRRACRNLPGRGAAAVLAWAFGRHGRRGSQKRAGRSALAGPGCCLSPGGTRLAARYRVRLGQGERSPCSQPWKLTACRLEPRVCNRCHSGESRLDSSGGFGHPEAGDVALRHRAVGCDTERVPQRPPDTGAGRLEAAPGPGVSGGNGIGDLTGTGAWDTQRGAGGESALDCLDGSQESPLPEHLGTLEASLTSACALRNGVLPGQAAQAAGIESAMFCLALWPKQEYILPRP